VASLPSGGPAFETGASHVWGLCWTDRHWGRVFSEHFGFSCQLFIPLFAPQSSPSVIQGWYSRPINGRSSSGAWFHSSHTKIKDECHETANSAKAYHSRDVHFSTRNVPRTAREDRNMRGPSAAGPIQRTLAGRREPGKPPIGINSLQTHHKDVWWSEDMAPPFLTSALDGGEWSRSRSCRLIPRSKALCTPGQH
jgi:hypothetical protein